MADDDRYFQPTDAERKAVEDTEFGQFYRQTKINHSPETGAETSRVHEIARGDGYTVNLNSLALRAGELEAVADAVADAVSTMPTDCGDFGSPKLDAKVAEVLTAWGDALTPLRKKIWNMSDAVRGQVNAYHENDQRSAERLRVPGVDYDVQRVEGATNLKNKFGGM